MSKSESPPEQAKQIYESLPRPSDGLVAKRLGVSRTTVRNWRANGWAYKGSPQSQVDNKAPLATERLKAEAVGTLGKEPVVTVIDPASEQGLRATCDRGLETVNLVFAQIRAYCGPLVVEKPGGLSDLLTACGATVLALVGAMERASAMATEAASAEPHRDNRDHRPIPDIYAEFTVIPGGKSP